MSMMQEAKMPSLKDKITAEPAKEVRKSKKLGGTGRASETNKESKKTHGKKK